MRLYLGNTKASTGFRAPDWWYGGYERGGQWLVGENSILLPARLELGPPSLGNLARDPCDDR